MEPEPFDACWRRLDRADVHRREAIEIWNDYIDEHPCQYALDHEGGGVHILRVWRGRPMPTELAVVTGEWFYSLRSALDYLIWATAVHVSGALPPPGEGALQYPIYDTEQAWTNNLYRLKPLADHHREMLREMQPFASDNDLAWRPRSGFTADVDDRGWHLFYDTYLEGRPVLDPCRLQPQR